MIYAHICRLCERQRQIGVSSICQWWCFSPTSLRPASTLASSSTSNRYSRNCVHLYLQHHSNLSDGIEKIKFALKMMRHLQVYCVISSVYYMYVNFCCAFLLSSMYFSPPPLPPPSSLSLSLSSGGWFLTGSSCCLHRGAVCHVSSGPDSWPHSPHVSGGQQVLYHRGPLPPVCAACDLRHLDPNLVGCWPVHSQTKKTNKLANRLTNNHLLSVLC